MSLYSFLYGLSFFISFFLAIYLGKLADRYALRKRFFVLFTFMVFLCGVLLGLFWDSLVLTLSLYMLMVISHQQAWVFYSSMLVGFEKMGIASGFGVASGYVASAFALILVAPHMRVPYAFWQISLVFLLLSVPSLLLLTEPGQRAHVRIRDLLSDKKFLLLCVSILSLTEVANTLVAMMGVYLREVYSMQEGEIYRVIGLSALGGVLGGPLWGKLVDLLGAKRVFPVGFFLWLLFLVLLYLSSRAYVLAVGLWAGLSLAHLWTSSRVLLLENFPKGESSVRMSFLSLTERIASSVGLWVWSGLLVMTDHNYRLSALLMVVFPLLGFLLYLISRPSR